MVVLLACRYNLTLVQRKDLETSAEIVWCEIRMGSCVVCSLWVKLQKLDDLLVYLVVVFEAHRIKGVPASASGRRGCKARL